MGLLDGLEKLINEHGSAVILRERIQLANDKYAALERKLIDAEAEAAALKSKVGELTSKLAEAVGQEKKDPGVLDGEREAILRCLCTLDGATDAKLAEVCKLSEPRVTFHLQALEHLRFVNGSRASRLGAGKLRIVWTIRQPGLEYLHARGLLP
jgi:hypothetical protein